VLHPFCKYGKSKQFYYHSPCESSEFSSSRYTSQTPMRSFYGFKFESHIRIVPEQEICLISILLNTLNFLFHNNDKIVVIGLHFGGLKSWRVSLLRLVRMPALTLSHTHVENLVNMTTWKWGGCDPLFGLPLFSITITWFCVGSWSSFGGMGWTDSHS